MAKKTTVAKWWQAFRISWAIAVSLVVLFVYTQSVAEKNFKDGARVGFQAGVQQCPQPRRQSLTEEVVWPTAEYL